MPNIKLWTFSPRPHKLWLSTQDCFACGHLTGAHVEPNCIPRPREGGCTWIEPVIVYSPNVNQGIAFCDCKLTGKHILKKAQ